MMNFTLARDVVGGEDPNISAASAHLNPGSSRVRRQPAALLVLALAIAFALAFGVTQAKPAVVAAAPIWPIPVDAAAGPPPMSALPAASDAAPPADRIADPVTVGAGCSGWYLQSTYGDRWPAGSTWWEYRCSYESTFYSNPCTSGACDAFCWYCYWETHGWTDYFYWNGSDAVFYGEAYSDSIVWEGGIAPDSSSADWWDAATAQWYRLGRYSLTVSRAGTGSGAVTSSSAGISCGDSCEASFEVGSTVSLTATPDASSVFTGWSRDCSGSGDCQVTMNQARAVTATFALKTFALAVSNQGAGSGQVSSSPAGISCGATCQVSFTAGTTVVLTATPDTSSVFAGWSADCSGTGTCQVTLDQARAVTATFKPNTAPAASFTVTCAGLACSFDGSGSSDSDGTIASHAWSFGDGASGTGPTASHSYAKPGSYTVTLTVTDNGGATATASIAVNPISLSARGHKQNGLQKVDLAWSGPSGMSFDVYRNGSKVTMVSTTAYTDAVGKGPGSYRYMVCASATSTCSNDAAVSF
jgi:PKD repeat protein